MRDLKSTYLSKFHCLEAEPQLQGWRRHANIQQRCVLGRHVRVSPESKSFALNSLPLSIQNSACSVVIFVKKKTLKILTGGIHLKNVSL